MKAESMFKLGRMATAGAFVAGSLFAGQAALACTLDNWSQSSASPAPLASGPTGPNGKPAIARYSGLCAMQTPDGVSSFVQDNNPSGIGRIITRFYVLADNTENAVIYRGFDSSGGELFNVSLAADGQVTLSSGGTSTDPVAGVSGEWNSIELDWDAANGLVLTVNNEAPASVNFSASSMVDSVRLGNLDGAAGTMNFDSYESRRSTPVGRLCRCNANGDAEGSVDIQDIVTTINELGGGALASGTPDCNEDGSVDVQDFVTTVNIVGGTGACLD